MKKQIYALILLLPMLLTGCGPTVKAKQTDGRPAVGVSKAEPLLNGSSPSKAAGSKTAPKVKPDSEFTLTISGDVLSHVNNLKTAQKPDGTYDYLPQFEDIKGLLSAGDLTLVNMETPVSGSEFGYRGFPKFNAPVNLAETLKKVGVDLVITANNHIMDNGLEGLNRNLDNLDGAKLLHMGAARSKTEAETPYILEINGIRTGFAASTFQPNIKVPNDYSAALNDETAIRSRIGALRKAGAELIVYHIHWGAEYKEYPSETQIRLYQILRDEGVDIVIGSHPHRLQPIEMRSIAFEGKQKEQAVIWSTANLLWGEPMTKDFVNTGAVFSIKVQRRNNEIQVASLNYNLVYDLNTSTVKGVRRIKIIPESDMERYKDKYPSEYANMKEEFAWAHKVLSGKVTVPDQN